MIRSTSLAALAALVTLSACASAGGDGPAPLTPSQRFSLMVEPGMERIALAVHDTGMSAGQDAALRDLAGAFAASGASSLIVQAPSGDDPVAGGFAYAVADRLNSLGYSGRVQVVGYQAPDPRAPVLVGYEILTAAVPQCGTRWGDLTHSGRNEVSSNFGCAVTANLAAQIANPRDIVAPRDMPPVDSGRRAVVLDKYRTGEATSAPQEELVARSRVSQAVE